MTASTTPEVRLIDKLDMLLPMLRLDRNCDELLCSDHSNRSSGSFAFFFAVNSILIDFVV
jgi:hypothetical protein